MKRLSIVLNDLLMALLNDYETRLRELGELPTSRLNSAILVEHDALKDDIARLKVIIGRIGGGTP